MKAFLNFGDPMYSGIKYGSKQGLWIIIIYNTVSISVGVFVYNQ